MEGMMKKGSLLTVALALLLCASCGRQQQAKSVVMDFMSQQLHKDVRYLDFSDLDSTRAIGDSLIMVLRQRTAQDIVYQERTGHTLLFLRANYLEGSDTLSATFYMDTQLTGVVAFKHN